MTKVIYFTVASKPTANELLDIAALQAYPGLTVAVRDMSKVGVSTDQGEPEVADYVASDAGNDFPEGYDDPGDYPVLDPAAPPAPDGLLGTQRVIYNGVEFLANDKTGVYVNGWTPTIAAGVVSTMLAS